jgi:hypothetical protein
MPLSISRRAVLRQAGAVQNIAQAQTTRGEDHWELVRRQFIFPKTAVPVGCADGDLAPSFMWTTLGAVRSTMMIGATITMRATRISSLH